MKSMSALEWVGSDRSQDSISFTLQENERKGQAFAWAFFLGTLLALILLGSYLASDSFMYG